MDTVIGKLVTAGSTNDTNLVVTDARGKTEIEFMIKIIGSAGGIKFGKNAVNAAAHPWVTGDTLFITCMRNELYFDASNAADTFVVTC